MNEASQNNQLKLSGTRMKLSGLLLLIATVSANPLSTESSIDWRTKGVVLPVPNQGQCGEAGMINALDAVSSMSQIKSGELVKLSAQQVYDCGGDICPCQCQGGTNVTQVYSAIWSEELGGRIDSDQSYPSTGECTKQCHFTKSGVSAVLTGFASTSSEQGLAQLLADGPVVALIEANNQFIMYVNGVLDDPTCKGDNPNHYLLVVGYGSEDGTDYWIARNSWGTNWGEDGYIRLVRGKNMCGVGNQLIQPIVA